MRAFADISQALRYAVYSLAGHGHGYIIDICGLQEVEQSLAATIQVVPACFVDDKEGLDLTIHLPFDSLSGTFGELVRFLDTQGHELFEERRHDGILFFAINLGRDVALTTGVLMYLLDKVFGYPAHTEFHCTVHDEGPVAAQTASVRLLPSAVELRMMPQEVRDAILQEAAALADELYRNDNSLTEFEAFEAETIHVKATAAG